MPADYATTLELKSYLGISDTQQDTLLASALSAASRAVDRITGRRFYLDAAESTRTFEVTNPAQFYIDDLSALTFGVGNTPVIVNTDDGTGTYTTTLDSEGYQFLQETPGGPYTILRALGTAFPLSYAYGRAELVQITGVWGWPTVPEDVKYATLIEAARLFHRKDSPQGVAGFGEFGGIRVSKMDADVEFLLGPYRVNFGIA